MSNALIKILLMHSIRPDNFVRKVNSGTRPIDKHKEMSCTTSVRLSKL